MAKPIQKRLLIHTVTHKYDVTTDSMGAESYKTRTIQFVRVEPSSKVVYKQDNNARTLSGTMFYDSTHSTPQDVVFVEGDKITFNGVERRIEEVTALYDNVRLHHYEVGLG